MNERPKEYAMTFAPYGWLVLFFLIPTVLVFAYAFKAEASFLSLFWQEYGVIFWRTIWLSLVTTFVCLSLSLPLGYFLARASTRLQKLFLLLVIMPFWSSFLVRIFAWKTLLHPEGILRKTLTFLHIIDADTFLLYNLGTVLVVMIYSYLPFAILPIYAQSVKFNYTLIEAARDLGASESYAFFKIFVPGIRRGILTAAVLVFIPAIGAYVIPDVVGGTSSEMIGNKISQRIFIDRNLPQASALSSILCLVVLVPIAISAYLHSRGERQKQ
ncbi:MAG: ABC transporter permease [Verrucomicrobia bacterium]|nr:ABC transporter permease [Verrucomicrobiota bacterium]MBS0636440.1 ABC transporter permease [Verrucomicrobiota bacterium]